ncbi:MAG: DUF2170 family protein [Mariprofundaceae bacterium]|nr:DUF2170 family protein [Mariprofundaceae bacterium]
MFDINIVRKLLEKYDGEQGLSFDVQEIPGETPTFSVVVDGREELPIYISSTNEEVLCICHLFDEDEVKSESVAEMNQAMLTMNVPMPLSSFGIIGSQYVVFGAMSARSDIDELAHELGTLSGNSIDAIEALSDYLK